MDLCVGGRPASQRGSDFNSNSVETRVTLTQLLAVVSR